MGANLPPHFAQRTNLQHNFEVIRNPEFGTDIKPKAAEGFAQ